MRLSSLTRTDLAPDAQPIWDKIAGARVSLGGPYQILLRIPKLADAISSVGALLRLDSLLSDQDRELAILATAMQCSSSYVWKMHEPICRAVGVRSEAIEVVRTGKAALTLEARDRL